MMNVRTPLAAIAIVFAVGAGLDAHHGRDFLLARTAELPHPGQIFLVPRQDVIRQLPTTVIELEPSLMFGASERLALEIHSHIAREDETGFAYESIAPAVHVRLTPEESVWGAGASVEYEISRGEGQSDRLETRLVASRQTGLSRLAINIFAGHGGTDEQTGLARSGLDWNYAAGFRRRVSGKVDLGVEGQGEFSATGVHEVLAGLYSEPSGWVTINVGAGVGMGPDAPSLTVRTAVVFRLR
ncbi:MAG: hypothetical protein ACM36C_05285 [Acidobacteriota bacterium]